MGETEYVPPEPLLERTHTVADRLERGVVQKAIAASLFPALPVQHESVGRYLLERRLGRGGMGIVFVGRDPMLDREVAIKVLRPSRTSSDTSSALLREAQLTARLSHPSIITIFDVGVHEGGTFIAMEYVEGQSMAEWLASRPPWRVVVAVLARAARGIAAAHARGVIHRDFKPANVLLGRDGRVRVADFGLAREMSVPSSELAWVRDGGGSRAITREGDIIGTPAYMAPEQYLGITQDERTDQYAFCVTLFEALYGQRPFEVATLVELRDAVLAEEPDFPPDPELPPALIAAVRRGLSKLRRLRFGDMDELAALLESFSDGVDLEAAMRELSPALPEGAPLEESRPESASPSRSPMRVSSRPSEPEPPPPAERSVDEREPVHPTVEGFSIWRRVGIIYHPRPPTTAEAAAQIEQLDRVYGAMGQPLAVLLVVENVFPPPSLRVQSMYRALIQRVRPEAIVVLVEEGDIAASMARGILVGVVLLANSMLFEIAKTESEAARLLAPRFGEGGTHEELLAAIRALRNAVGRSS